MNIRNFIPVIMSSIASMFPRNKAKMNQPATPVRHAAISTSPATVAARVPIKVAAPPKRAVKPAKAIRTEHLTISRASMFAQAVKRNGGKVARVLFVSRDGNPRTADVTGIKGSEVILRRHKNGGTFTRFLAPQS